MGSHKKKKPLTLNQRPDPGGWGCREGDSLLLGMCHTGFQWCNTRRRNDQNALHINGLFLGRIFCPFLQSRSSTEEFYPQPANHLSSCRCNVIILYSCQCSCVNEQLPQLHFISMIISSSETLFLSLTKYNVFDWQAGISTAMLLPKVGSAASVLTAAVTGALFLLLTSMMSLPILDLSGAKRENSD